MKPYLSDNGVTIYHGSVLSVLKTLPSQSVNCIVTSPPYWGLRAYGTDPQIWRNGRELCADGMHEWTSETRTKKRPDLPPEPNNAQRTKAQNIDAEGRGKREDIVMKSDTCSLCGAWRGELGLEPTPELYVEHIAQIFREARRVLRDDGVMFLNIGDSYYGSNPGSGGKTKKQITNRGSFFSGARRVRACGTFDTEQQGLKCRDCAFQNLCGERKDSWLCYISRIYDHHALLQFLESLNQILGYTDSMRAHLPSEDLVRQKQIAQSALANWGLLQNEVHAFLPRLFSLASKIDESFRQQSDHYPLLDSLWAFRAGLRSFSFGANRYARMLVELSETPDCTKDNALLCEELAHHIQYIFECCSLVLSLLNTPYIQPQDTTDKYTCQLKPKDLVGIPWRVAFALQADGWYLRQDIIWHKPNPIPESVKDRFTKAHEYIFLLTKSARYYFDNIAIAEPAISTEGTRNKRSVLEVNTQPFKGGHFAVFPERLVEPMILAGTSAHGVCSKCGSPYISVVKTGERKKHASEPQTIGSGRGKGGGRSKHAPPPKREEVGWFAQCNCRAKVVPATVLDPFMGSGTALMVAKKHGRNAIGIELNEDYIKLAIEYRLASIQPTLDNK